MIEKMTPAEWEKLIEEVRIVSEQDALEAERREEEMEARSPEALARAAAMDMLEALEEFFAHRTRVFLAQMRGYPLPDILPVLHRMAAAVRKARGVTD